MNRKASPKTDALIASLTLAHALEWNRQVDKLMWIETELLDPRDISRNMAERVEYVLESIYEANVDSFHN